MGLRARWAPLVASGSVCCRRCGLPIAPGSPWDLGHAVDRALGGSDHDVAPEHARCNRSAGGRLAAQLRPRPARRAPVRPAAVPDVERRAW